MNSFINRTILILSLLVVSSSFSQKESAIWYFGDYAGLDFNSGSPEALTDSQLITNEGCATISDISGNLLFYTDGSTVWDRNHQKMPNGEDLLGHSSSTESALIVPNPGNPSSYYIFTIDKPSYYLTPGLPIDGVNYSEVDMTLNNGFGDILEENKNIHLITYNTNDSSQSEFKSSEKITAVTNSNGNSVWVITHFVNKFYAFLVDENGVNPDPIVSSTQLAVYPRFREDGSNISAIGYLKVSPNGRKIAIAHSSTALGSPTTGTKKSGKVLVYDFNNSTGEVSNQTTILTDVYPYGLEFSPNSKLLYVTLSIFGTDDIFQNSYLYQYNLESSNIAGSKQTINNSQNVAGALQLAIDGKIYRAGYPTNGVGNYISVINNPNQLGTSCEYHNNSVNLGGKASQLGLPPFVQSLFLATFKYENTCIGDDTQFYITSEDPYDSLVWNFGDGHTSTEIDPSHTYSQPGVYNVSLTFTVNTIEQDPYITQVTISEPPDVLQQTYELIQCDFFDDDPSDGISTFNLELANQPISLNSEETIRVFYYHTVSQAINDEDNLSAINTIYTNQYQGEELIAKVYQGYSECYSIATIRLVTTPSVYLNTFSFDGCDLENNGIGEFDLETKKNDIISTLNLPTDVSITFYETEEEAAIGTNPVSDIYVSGPRILYIRAESDNACYGNGILELNVVAFPELSDHEIIICDDNFPILIDSGIDNALVNDYNFSWNLNENTNQIQVSETGTYTVSVTDPVLNCGKEVQVVVKNSEIPDIQELLIDDTNLTVNLNNHESGFLFNIDDEFGVFQASNTFLNIEPGSHMLYIKDVYNCNITSREFFILGVPKFFTPNNDGNHDMWNIKGLDPLRFPNTRIQIFDRYGKLIKEFNPVYSEGWNGKFNSELLTPDDYWYYIELPNGQVFRGHFTLKV